MSAAPANHFIMMLGWDCVDFGRCVYGGGRCAFDSYSSR